MMHPTPQEIGDFVRELPEDAEVFVTVSAGRITRTFWTDGVNAVESPSGTPEFMRWPRAVMLGLSDAVGIPTPSAPSDGGSTPPVPPAALVR